MWQEIPSLQMYKEETRQHEWERPAKSQRLTIPAVGGVLVNLYELTFEGEANPRSRLLHGRTSADAQGQQKELGSRRCHGNRHAGSPQRSKSGQKRRGMNYYYRVPHEKYETWKEKDRRETLVFSDLSDQKFGLQPSEETYGFGSREQNPNLHTCSGKYDRPITYLKCYCSEVCVKTV